MGRDAHVGKDPESKKGKSEVQRLEEATNFLSEEAHEQAISDSNRHKTHQKNPPGHVEFDGKIEHFRIGDKDLRLHSPPGGKPFWEGGPISHVWKDITKDNDTWYEKYLKTDGSGMYAVGHDMGNGTKVQKIEIRELSKDVIESGFSRSVQVILDNNTVLSFMHDHLRSILYTVGKGDRNAFFQYDQKGMLTGVHIDGRDFTRVGPKKWSIWKKDSSETWHGSFDLAPNGDLRKLKPNGDLDTAYLNDGTIVNGDRKKQKHK